MSFKTEQENFWSTEFGNEYIERNQEWKNKVPLFSKALRMTDKIDSVIEFGCNIGLNIKALSFLFPSMEFSGVEINEQPSDILNENNNVKVFNTSIFDYKVEKTCDMSMIKGVLIHINPEMLKVVYEKLYKSSNQYIFISEYYNPTPIEVEYRGHKGKLFKRDFAGEMLDIYPDLKLVDYGFVYHRDNHFPQDDDTWFLLEKKR